MVGHRKELIQNFLDIVKITLKEVEADKGISSFGRTTFCTLVDVNLKLSNGSVPSLKVYEFDKDVLFDLSEVNCTISSK